MATAQKQSVRAIYKVAAFLAFIMLGYLGIRSYKQSVDKLKSNNCIEEIVETVRNIQEGFRTSFNYKDLDYKRAVSLGLIPKRMFKEGFTEAVNSYMGGIDFYYSSWVEPFDSKAFEVSFQGLSPYGCITLLRLPWDSGQRESFLAVGGFGIPTPSGVLDDVLVGTEAKDIRNPHIFLPQAALSASDEKIRMACDCIDNDCSVVWKFH